MLVVGGGRGSRSDVVWCFICVHGTVIFFCAIYTRLDGHVVPAVVECIDIHSWERFVLARTVLVQNGGHFRQGLPRCRGSVPPADKVWVSVCYASRDSFVPSDRVGF